jgi:hypothetical protein
MIYALRTKAFATSVLTAHCEVGLKLVRPLFAAFVATASFVSDLFTGAIAAVSVLFKNRAVEAKI